MKSENKMSEKQTNKVNKRLIIGGVILMCTLIFGLVAIKNITKSNIEKATNLKNEGMYEVNGEESLKFKGTSIISKEQNISIDRTQGEVKDLKVVDKQEVKAGDIIFTYHSTQVANQKEELNRQINSNSQKNERSNKNKGALNSELNTLTKKLETEKSSNSNGLGDLDPKIVELNQKLGEVKGKIELEENAINTFNDTINDLTAQKDLLTEQESKSVKAEIDGILYIYDKGLTDITSPYIKIVSKEPLIRGEASEFEIDSIRIGDKALLKVVSNDELIKGVVTSIDELPTISLDGKSTSYSFNIKPEKAIRIGFNVEIKLNYDGLTIPKECVIEEDTKLYVVKSSNFKYEKVEIKASLSGENYILQDDTIVIGDKLSQTPNDDLKVEGE